MRKRLAHTDEPTAADLAAIEVEWPLIAAEIDVLDAEITLIYAADHGGPSPLDWRRLRRAEARVTRAAAELAAHPAAGKVPARRATRVDAMPAPADLAEIQADHPLIVAELGLRPAAGKAVA